MRPSASQSSSATSLGSGRSRPKENSGRAIRRRAGMSDTYNEIGRTYSTHRRAPSPVVSQLAIFDIDGTLTDTTGVDDECYRLAVAEALDLSPDVIDWSGAAHVTDSEIFRWLCGVHGRAEVPES